MSMQEILAWFGLRAVPHLHDVRVHDALNEDTVSIAGLRIIARQSLRVSEAMTSAPEDIPCVNRGVDDMRAIMAEVARRADR